MAEKSSSSSSSGIDKALEGEPIIMWTCAVLKECLRSQGGRLTGKKKIPRLEADRSLGDERLVCYLDWKLVLTELSSVTQTPRLQPHWKVLFLDAQRQTTRQRSRTTALARVHRLHRLTEVTLWWCTFCPSAFRLVNFMGNFFRGGVTISNKKKLSQFLLKKKLVWFCEWAIIIMPGCSWNFFSEPFCEMHSVVTVKTVEWC